MKKRLLDILHFFLKTAEVGIALLLVAYPLLLYGLAAAYPSASWPDTTLAQKLILLAVFGGLPAFCGLVWLKLIWQRRRQLAEYERPPRRQRMRGTFSKLMQTLLVVLVVAVPAFLLGGGCVWMLIDFSDVSIHWAVRYTVGVMGWSALVLIGYGTLKASWLAWLRIGQIWRPPPEKPSE